MQATSIKGCVSEPFIFDIFQSAIANVNLDDVTLTNFSDNSTITINSNNNLGVSDYEFALDNPMNLTR